MPENATRRYARRFIAAIGGYTVLLILSLWLLRLDLPLIAEVAVAVMPVLPVLLGMSAFVAFLRAMDEMQRQIQFQAFGFSLLATSVVTFTLGFLENAGLPRIGLIWVMPMVTTFWGVGQWFAARDYT